MGDKMIPFHSQKHRAPELHPLGYPSLSLMWSLAPAPRRKELGRGAFALFLGEERQLGEGACSRCKLRMDDRDQH